MSLINFKKKEIPSGELHLVDVADVHYRVTWISAHLADYSSYFHKRTETKFFLLKEDAQAFANQLNAAMSLLQDQRADALVQEEKN